MRFSLTNINSIQFFNLLRFGATLLIGIGLTKTDLSTAEIAIYESLLFLGNMLSFFWIGGGQSGLLSLFPKLKDQEKGVLVFQSFVLFSLLGMITAALLLALSGPIVRNLTHFESLPYVHWLALYIMLNTPSWLVHLYYLLQGAHKAIINWGILSFGGQLAVVLIPVYLTGDLETAFIGLVCLGFLKYLWTLALVFYQGTFRFSIPVFTRFIAISLPLMLNLLVGNSTEYIDGLIVTSQFEDTGTFAIFRYGARELPLVTLIVGGLMTALLPVISGDEADGLLEVRRRTAQFSNFLFPLSAVLMLLSPWLFSWVYNPEFRESAFVFNVYLLIIISRILLPQLVIIGRNRSYILVRNALFESLLNVGLSLWLVQQFGLLGIAYATVIAFILAKLSLIWFVWSAFRIPPNAYIPLRSWGVWSVFLLCCFIAVEWMY